MLHTGLEQHPAPGFKEWAKIEKVGMRKGVPIFRLCNTLEYTSESGTTFIVAKGFISDLGSVPRWLWPVLPPHEFPSSYILHDRLCRAANNSPRRWQRLRARADALLLESLKYSNAGWKRYVISTGVRFYATCVKPVEVFVQKVTEYLK